MGKRLADVEALERSLASRGGAGLRLTVRGARCSARWREGPFSTAAALRGVEVSIQVLEMSIAAHAASVIIRPHCPLQLTPTLPTSTDAGMSNTLAYTDSHARAQITRILCCPAHPREYAPHTHAHIHIHTHTYTSARVTRAC